MSQDTDFTWLVEHDQSLSEKYPRKWIAIWHERVIAVGDTALQVAEQADKIAPPEEYILHALDERVDVIYAGF